MDTDMAGDNVRGIARDLLRFWVPAGLLDIYRRHRLRTSDPLAIPERDASFSLESRSLEELFPGILEGVVAVPTSQVDRPAMVLPLVELLTVGAICGHLRPSRVFEIGTYTGSTTLLLALNTSEDTLVHTLDLDPGLTQAGATAGAGAPVGGGAFTAGECFAGTPVAERITQLFGDSRAFDFGPYRGTADLVFVDGNHSYPFVKADTDTAFRLLRPGGVIIWDDYRWAPANAHCAGVTRALNELAGSIPVRQIAGTRLAIYVDGPGQGVA